MPIEYSTNRDAVSYGQSSAVAFDAGLRAYMLSIYNYMGAGLIITGLVAWFTAHTPALASLFLMNPETKEVGSLYLLAVFSPLAFILVLSFGINRLPLGAAKAIFFAFSGVMGLSMAGIFSRYDDVSIYRTFFITASVFLSMSLWGYTTKRDLTGMGHFFMMGLIGIVIASLVNLFMHSNALQFAVSVLGVLIFTGLTAYDTQKCKQMYAAGYGREGLGKLAIMGALTLYLDFINLFQFLLQFLGRRE
jgi:FtsH-binding integral membrane protein